MKSLVKEIKNLQKDIRNHIQEINSGGCCRFAYYLSKRLAELKIEHKICICDSAPITLRYDAFNSVRHVLVYIPEVGYFDGEIFKTKYGIRTKYEYHRTKKLSLVKLSRFINEYEWNDEYNIDQDDLLQELIKQNITNGISK